MTNVFAYPTTVEALRDWLPELKRIFVAQLAAVLTLHTVKMLPGDNFVMAWDARKEVSLPRIDGSYRVEDAEQHILEYITLVARHPKYTSTLAGEVLIIGIVTQMVNASAQMHLDTKHPSNELFQFMRHVRNAVAHGGYFDIRGKKPLAPATFRHLSITRELNGTSLWHFIKMGDILDLMDDLGDELSALI
jgi:hypothetical protein